MTYGSIAASAAVSLLIGATAKGALVMVSVAMIRQRLRRASAAVRHAIGAAGMAALLALPLLIVVLPRWDAPILPANLSRNATALLAGVASRACAPSLRDLAGRASVPSLSDPAQGPLPFGVAHAEHPGLAAGSGTAFSRISDGSSPNGALKGGDLRPNIRRVGAGNRALVNAQTALLWIWLCGAVLAFARLAVGLIAAGVLVRRSRPVTAARECRALHQAQRDLGIDGAVDLRRARTGERPTVPMTCGLWRPVILLPALAESWPEERLRAVLLHELAHVRRCDWVTLLLTQSACCLYWHLPLVPIAATRLRLEAENASDDIVLRTGVASGEYARCLLDIVRGIPTTELAAALAMARPRDVEIRLAAILARQRDRSEVTWRGSLAAAILLLLAVPMACLRLVPSAIATQIGRLPWVGSAFQLQLVRTIQPGSPVTCTVFTPDGDRLLTGLGRGGSSPSSLALWSVMSGRELSDRAAGSTLQSAAYSPDGTLLATAYAGGDVRISAGAGGRTRIDAHVPLRSVGQLEFSPDGLTIACGDLSGQGSKSARPALVLLNAQSGRRYRDGALGSPRNTPGRDPGAYRGFFRGLAETWNGRPFAVGAPTWRVLTWNHGITLGTTYGGAPDEQLTQTPAIACATAGDLVAALDTSGTIRLWDSASGNLLAKGYLGRSTVGGKLAFSHDGRFLACTCHDTITVWHVS